MSKKDNLKSEIDNEFISLSTTENNGADSLVDDTLAEEISSIFEVNSRRYSRPLKQEVYNG